MEFEATVGLQAVPDNQLLHRLAELVSQSRRVEADLVAHIGEADERRLYARQAFPSMFAYCTQALHLSEAEAYRRITVARAARRYPQLLAALRDGRVHLSGLALLAPLVTADNCARLLERAEHRSKREIEELVAELAPRPDVRSGIRKLPRARVASAVPSADTSPIVPVALGVLSEPMAASDGLVHMQGDAPASELFPGRVRTTAVASRTKPLPSVTALSPARYKVQFTASAELRNKLERLQALMRPEVPDGDLGAIVERAVTEKLERLEARRFAKSAAPRTVISASSKATSRHIPAALRRAVSQQAGMRCSFVDAQGRRCSERHRLEFHHRHPFGMGGEHSSENIGLLCSAHNRLMAERDFGTGAIQQAVRFIEVPTSPPRV